MKEVCCNCGEDVSQLADWDTCVIGRQFCSLKCSNDFKKEEEE